MFFAEGGNVDFDWLNGAVGFGAIDAAIFAGGAGAEDTFDWFTENNKINKNAFFTQKIFFNNEFD